jgi:hypothetical protein
MFSAWAKIGIKTINRIVRRLLETNRYFLLHIFIVLMVVITKGNISQPLDLTSYIKFSPDLLGWMRITFFAMRTI